MEKDRGRRWSSTDIVRPIKGTNLVEYWGVSSGCISVEADVTSSDTDREQKVTAAPAVPG